MDGRTDNKEWWNRPDWAFSLPANLKKHWAWFAAVWAFDYGDPLPLSVLIQDEQIPAEFKKCVADIVLGSRKPNKKAIAKTKILANKRAEAASYISVCKTLRDTVKSKGFAEEHAKTVEPIELIRAAETELGLAAASVLNEEYGVSLSAVDNLEREAKERLSRWPSI